MKGIPVTQTRSQDNGGYENLYGTCFTVFTGSSAFSRPTSGTRMREGLSSKSMCGVANSQEGKFIVHPASFAHVPDALSQKYLRENDDLGLETAGSTTIRNLKSRGQEMRISLRMVISGSVTT